MFNWWWLFLLKQLKRNSGNYQTISEKHKITFDDIQS